MGTSSPNFILTPEIARAQQQGRPIVVLESTVITHGLPYPENLALARDMEARVTATGAVPATIALIGGQIHIGLSPEQLELLATAPTPRKISTRDFATAKIFREHGGTTVAGTLYIAHLAGLKVFATGGIGGVHHEPRLDISTDLPELARTPLVVVCAGAKAILDLPATLEYLETAGVPVLGFQTSEFPAFYSRESGLAVSARVESARDVVDFADAHWGLGFRSAILVTVPPPAEAALPPGEVNAAIEQAIGEARAHGIRGQAVSPFLLSRVSALSGHKSMDANLALLKNNAGVAAEIAVEMAARRGRGARL